MKIVGRLVRLDDGATIVSRLAAADGFWSRLTGLQFRSPLPTDEGLLIVPCSSIHTACLRFALDVVFLDDRGCVVDLRRGLRPWRVAFPRRSCHAVVETTAGALPALSIGDRLRLVPATSLDVSPALLFLVDELGERQA